MPTAVYNADFSQFDQETAKATEAVKKFTSEAEKSAKDLGKIDAAMGGVAEQVTAVGTSFLKLTGAVAVGSLLADTVKALGTAVADTFKDTIKYADSLADLSAKSGMTTTGLQKLAFATEQSGVSLESVTQASTKLGAALVAGDKSVVGGLTKLGLSVGELRNLQPDQLFVKVADAIGKIPDPMERARRAQEIFGKQGLELLPALTGEMAKTVAEAEKLGIIISPEVIANAAKLADQFDILALQGRAFVAEALAPMVPLLSQMVQGISDVAGGVIENLKRAFSDPGILGAASTLKAAINDIFGTTQEERINTLTKLILELASAGVKTAEILVRSFSAVTGTITSLVAIYARLEQLDNFIKGKLGDQAAADASVKWGEYADSLNRAQRVAFEITSGTSPLIQYFRDVGNEIDKAKGKLVEFTREAIKPMRSTVGRLAAAGGGQTDAAEAAAAAAAAAAHKKAAEEAKKHKAELDKLTGQATINAAEELARNILEIGGASQVSGAQVAAQTAIISAGMRALVEDGKAVPPLWVEIAAKLELAALQTSNLVTFTGAYIQQIDALSHTDWSKVVPPPDLFPKVEQFKGPPAGVQAAPPVDLKPPKKVEFKDFFEPKQFTDELSKAIVGAWKSAEKGMRGAAVGEAVGTQLGTQLGKVAGAKLGEAIGGGIGAAVGSVVPVVGTILGGLAGKFIGGLFGPSQQKLAQQARDEWIKSVGGLEKIEEQAKRANVSVDALMKATTEKGLEKEVEKFNKALEESNKRIAETITSLGKLSAEGGLIGKDLVGKIKLDIDQKDVQEAVKQFQSIQTDKAVKGLTTFLTSTGSAFDNMTKALAAGGKGTKAAVEALGLSFDKVKDLKPEQAFEKLTTALAGVKDPAERARLSLELFGSSSIKTTAGLEAVAGGIAGLFGSLQQQGLSAREALVQMQPAIAAFQSELLRTGAQAPAAFGEIARLAQIAGGAITGPMIEGVAGLGLAMEGLQNTGLLTQEMFTGLTAEIGATFTALLDQGTGGSNAIALMQQPLQTVWELQQQFGFEVDDTTQAILDQAQSEGKIGEKFLPAADRIANSINTLVTKLDQLFTGMVTGAQRGATGAETAISTAYGRMTAGAQTAKTDIERTLGGIRPPTIEVPIVARYEGFDDIPSSSADVSPMTAASIQSEPITVTTVLDGEVIARNQIPHMARQLTLLGV